ncbi:MAG TPA: TIGR03619 family F420-dependent LLM class oxidoreductase [Dehalococcoidia bacterium]|jgi:probable F420-dependent oxidoreductase
MDIGLKIGPADERDALRRAATEAERVGVASVWLSERIVTPLDKPHPYQPVVDPWVALSFVAAVTDRVRLGTSVSQIATRPAVLMARELATLDRLSAGRLIVGVGAGWVIEEFVTTGIPFEDRGGRLSEMIRVLRHLWTTPNKPWDGKFYNIPPVGIVSPFAPGGPPIIAGALSDPGFRRVAKYCDGWTATGGTPEQIAAAKAKIDALRARYGRTGAFRVYVQVPPPQNTDAAGELARSYRDAGADELILTYSEPVPEAFLRAEAPLRALIETAAALP